MFRGLAEWFRRRTANPDTRVQFPDPLPPTPRHAWVHDTFANRDRGYWFVTGMLWGDLDHTSPWRYKQGVTRPGVPWGKRDMVAEDL